MALSDPDVGFRPRFCGQSSGQSSAESGRFRPNPSRVQPHWAPAFGQIRASSVEYLGQIWQTMAAEVGRNRAEFGRARPCLDIFLPDFDQIRLNSRAFVRMRGPNSAEFGPGSARIRPNLFAHKCGVKQAGVAQSQRLPLATQMLSQLGRTPTTVRPSAVKPERSCSKPVGRFVCLVPDMLRVALFEEAWRAAGSFPTIFGACHRRLRSIVVRALREHVVATAWKCHVVYATMVNLRSRRKPAQFLGSQVDASCPTMAGSMCIRTYFASSPLERDSTTSAGLGAQRL